MSDHRSSASKTITIGLAVFGVLLALYVLGFVLLLVDYYAFDTSLLRIHMSESVQDGVRIVYWPLLRLWIWFEEMNR